MKDKKRLKIGTYTTVICIVAIVIAVLANMLVGAIPSTYTKFDVTTQKLYKFSDETKKIIGNVDQDIEIYLVCTQGEENSYVEELLDRYCALNSHISFKKIDPVLHPSFVSTSGQSYTLGEYEANTLIVCGAKKDKVVSYSEIFTKEYSEEDYYYYYYYGETPSGTTNFNGEAKLTGALKYVCSKELPKLYTLTGHGEKELGSSMSGYLSDDNYDTTSLSLLTQGSVPDDASCVLINVPTSDISADELNYLESYIDAGGKVIIVSGYNKTEPSTFSNLCALGEYYGIKVMSGIVVEGDGKSYMSGYPYYIIASLGSSDMVSNFSSSQYVLMAAAHGLDIAETLPSNTTVETLLTTTASAYITNGESIDSADATYTGNVNLGLMAKKSVDDSAYGSLLWFSASTITDDDADQYVSGGNSTLFLSCINTLCDKEESVAIAAKSMAVESLVVSESEANSWSIVFAAVIPLTVVIGGLIYWNYRRKR